MLVAVGMGVVSDFLGLSATTGAFAAGVLLAESGYRAQIEVSERQHGARRETGRATRSSRHGVLVDSCPRTYARRNLGALGLLLT